MTVSCFCFLLLVSHHKFVLHFDLTSWPYMQWVQQMEEFWVLWEKGKNICNSCRKKKKGGVYGYAWSRTTQRTSHYWEGMFKILAHTSCQIFYNDRQRITGLSCHCLLCAFIPKMIDNAKTQNDLRKKKGCTMPPVTVTERHINLLCRQRARFLV